MEKLEKPLRGKVAIVGAGPGDPELLTIRAGRLLARADVILKDHLASDEILTLAPDARVIDVGKIPGGKRTSQEVINRLLIKEALAGAFVVRLKGGDPFVFGRGGEEAIALADAGVEFEIVPGISSCISVPERAGIPVTHRGITTHFSVVTGVGADKADLRKTWKNIASTGGTMVVLMGVSQLGNIIEAVLESGRSPQTPCAIIANGTTDDEFVLSADLCSIEQLVKDAQIDPPATLVIGDVVAVRDQLVREDLTQMFRKEAV